MKAASVLLVILILAACNAADETERFLAEPPYDALTDSLKRQPQNARLYYRRGALLYQNGQLFAAKADLEKAWQLQPTEEHALSVVTVLIKTDRDSAILFTKSALQQLPASIALQMGLARGFQQKGSVADALAVCDRILLMHPASLDALLLKADLLKQQNKKTEALATLEKAYSYAPFDAELCYNLAFEYAEAKNKAVLSLTDSLIHTDSTGRQPQPYYLKGVYYDNTGDPKQALYYYNQAIAHDYNFYDAYMDKGVLLFNGKKYDTALAVFNLVNRISPTYAASYYWAGKCQEALGESDEAKLNYQRAYGLDTSIHEAREAAAKL